MDSLAVEDATLPLELNSSSNIYKLPDVSGDGADLPSAVADSAKDRLLALRARTMKDFEKQITELKKENFNLKLRIYFLEEQIQQKFDGASEDIYKTNIELKVEVESLKHELHEKQSLLIKASKAVESLAVDRDTKVQRTKEDAQKKIQQIEDCLSSKIHALEEDLKISQTKVETLSTLLEKRAQTADIGHSAIKEMQQKALEMNPTLEEKDRIIKQLNVALESKESLINQLEKEKAQSKLSDGSCAKGKCSKSADRLQKTDEAAKTFNENQKQLANSDDPSDRVFEELEKAKVTVFSLQERLKEADQTNNDLKNCVLEKEEKLTVEQKNGLKRDKTIQGLTQALKMKEKETEELSQQIEDLSLSLSRAREAAHKAQIQKFKGVEDYQIILMEKETLLADLHTDNTAKDTEIRKLLGMLKKRDQEFSDSRREKERLEKELDEAQQQKSRSDKTINDLRNQLEKLNGEMIEKGTALECHYNILLNENNQKYQSQELMIRRLTESLSGKELSLQKLDIAFKEKEVELQQLFDKYSNLQKAKEMLESCNSCTMKEKDDVISHLQQLILRKNKELEDRKKSEYDELICTLRKEQQIYFTLIESVKDSDSISSLQIELNKICSLRKQLEEDVLANRDLRKMLETQMKATRGKEDDTFSFCGDQTSYMSICLRDYDHTNPETEKLSLQELQKKVSGLVLLVQDLQSANQALKEKLFECSGMKPQDKELLKMTSQNELFEKVEDATEKVEDQEKESSALNHQHPLEMEKVIQPVCLDDFQQDGHIKNKKECSFEQESNRKYFYRQDMKQHERKKMNILRYSDDYEILLFGPGLEPLEQEHEPRSCVFTAEEECSNENIQDMNDAALRDLVMELRAELRHFQQENTFFNHSSELKTPLSIKGKTTLEMNEEVDLTEPKMKDAATQMENTKENIQRTNSKYEKSILQEENCWTLKVGMDHFEEDVSKITEHQSALSSESLAIKTDKKSRLPIPIKSYRFFIKQGMFTDLQHQRTECQEELKVCKMQNTEFQEKLGMSELVIENLKDELQMAESVTENLKDKLQTAESVTENLRDKLQMAESVIENLKDKLQTAESMTENLKAKLHTSESITEHLKDKLHTAKLVSENLKDKLQTAESVTENLKDKLQTAKLVTENKLHMAESATENLWDKLHTSESVTENLSDKLRASESVIENLKDKLHTAESVTENLSDKLRASESVIENLRMKLHTTESVTANLSDKLHASESVIENLRAKLHTTRSVTENLPDKLRASESVIESLKDKLHTAESVTENLSDKLRASESLIENLRMKLNTTESETANLSDKLHASESVIENLRAKLHTTKSVTENLPDKLRASESVIENLKDKLHTAESVTANLSDKLHASESVIENLRMKLNTTESETANLSDKLYASESVIENLREKLHTAESEIENLKDCSNTNRALRTGSGIDVQFGNSSHVHCAKKLDRENSKNVLGTDELKQRIKEMEIQLENYQNVLCLLQIEGRRVSSNDSFNTVLTNLKTSEEDVLHSNIDENTNDQAQQTSFYSSNVTEVKRVELLKQQRMQLKSELQKEKATSLKLLDHVYNLQRKLKIMSPSRYDSLVQSQARELSFQRHQMKESFGICVMYRQHLKNLIKAFEELLQASDVDYCVAEGFREQLNQSLHMLETLEEKLQNEELCDSEVSLLFELSQRYKNDIQEMDKTTAHIQEHFRNESLPSSACPSVSDFETLDKSSVGSLEDNPDMLKREHEGLMHLPQNLSQDILMEHLQEIRMLRQRLEDSIKTNDRLREQLERQISNAELDQDKQNENEQLRESLSQKNFLVERIRSEYECVKKENEKLQQQLSERDEEIRCLTQDIHKSRNEVNRLQNEMNLQGHHFYEEQVYESVQIEQNLYKKLTEANRRKKDPDTDVEDKNVEHGDLFDAPDNGDRSSQCSSSSTVSMSCAPTRLVPGHHMWADKNGRHVLGLIEDYDALHKHISEGRKLVCGMEAYLEDIQNLKPQLSQSKNGDQGSSGSSATIVRLQQILDEVNRLLKLLWKVSLPSSISDFSQDEELKSEIARLRRKLSECETKLHSTVKRLHCTKQRKEDMEKIIIEQLASTHNVLKKARGNLEIQPVEVQH